MEIKKEFGKVGVFQLGLRCWVGFQLVGREQKGIQVEVTCEPQPRIHSLFWGQWDQWILTEWGSGLS